MQAHLCYITDIICEAVSRHSQSMHYEKKLRRKMPDLPTNMFLQQAWKNSTCDFFQAM